MKLPLLSLYPRIPLGALRVSDITGRRLDGEVFDYRATGWLTVLGLVQTHIVLKARLLGLQYQKKHSYLYDCDDIVLTGFYRTSWENKSLVDLCHDVNIICRTGKHFKEFAVGNS